MVKYVHMHTVGGKGGGSGTGRLQHVPLHVASWWKELPGRLLHMRQDVEVHMRLCPVAGPPLLRMHSCPTVMCMH